MKKELKGVDLSDIATVFLGEFALHNKRLFHAKYDMDSSIRVDFLKMSYRRRKALVKKSLDKMSDEINTMRSK